jgi:hypothetical protein
VAPDASHAVKQCAVAAAAVSFEAYLHLYDFLLKTFFSEPNPAY